MKLVIQMSLDNAAFTDNPDEIKIVLDKLSARMPYPLVPTDSPVKLRDTNGNTVGTASIIDDMEATKTRRHLDELARLVDEAQNYPNNYTNFEAMRSVIRLALLTA